MIGWILAAAILVVGLSLVWFAYEVAVAVPDEDIW